MDPQHDADSPLAHGPTEPAIPPAPARKWPGKIWPLRRGGPIDPRTVATALLFVLLAALWIDTRLQTHDLQQQLIRKLAEADNYNRESRQIASQARDASRDLEYRSGALEGRVAETQNQRLALEGLYLELSRSRDERILAEVEQILMIGSQQLTLAGNVKAALIALDSADNRLQRADSAQFTAIRRAIRRDLERLKALPYVDVDGMSVRLDALAQEVQSLPLAMEERPTEDRPPVAKPQQSLASRLAGEAWHELQNAIRIERIDHQDVPLLSPSQAFFLREALRLRLISARVSLLAHEEGSFKADTRQCAQWLQQYFNGRDRKVTQALATLRQISAAEINIEIPDISSSLDAVRNAKLVRERGLR
jgi:uroporphyrin-3 C-methyltransferase